MLDKSSNGKKLKYILKIKTAMDLLYSTEMKASHKVTHLVLLLVSKTTVSDLTEKQSQKVKQGGFRAKQVLLSSIKRQVSLKLKR